MLRRRRPARRARRRPFEPAGDLGDLAIPETLHALIAARLDALDARGPDAGPGRGRPRPDVHDGRRWPRVSGLEADALEPRLGALVRRGPAPPRVDPRSPERGQYAFVQAVIREVAYSTLALRDRRGAAPRGGALLRVAGRRRARRRARRHYLAAHRAAPEGPKPMRLRARRGSPCVRPPTGPPPSDRPLQAVTYLEQAIEVTDSEEDRARHAGAGRRGRIESVREPIWRCRSSNRRRRSASGLATSAPWRG